MKLLIARMTILLAHLARPVYELLLMVPRSSRRRRAAEWKPAEGAIEHVAVLVPDGSPDPYRWRVEVTFSYSYGGDYFSGLETRTFLRRRDANEFLSALGDYSTRDAVSDGAGSDRLDALEVAARKSSVNVLVDPNRPNQAIIANFLEDAASFAASVQATVQAR